MIIDKASMSIDATHDPRSLIDLNKHQMNSIGSAAPWHDLLNTWATDQGFKRLSCAASAPVNLIEQKCLFKVS